MYVIQNINDPTMFWSNESGWTDIDSADSFTLAERLRLNLPVDGQWLQLYDDRPDQY